jgi:hypothetical protein
MGFLCISNIVSQEMSGDVITHCLECDQEIYQQCECNVILVIALLNVISIAQ